ncbi:MAG: hypothetical protein M5R36_01295 [Deltaproteobacteria bacterium]|nr:hypothetical protein [Deltaproteobacteria bacterium]
MRRPVSILTVAMLLIAAPASAQLFPDIWPLSDDEDAHHPAMADLELLETLCTKGVLDEATCDETRRKMARSRLSGLHPRGELAVAYTADNQTQADEVVSYPGSPVDERGFRLTKASLGVEGSVYFPWLKTKWVAEARERDDGHYELELEYGQISVLCGPPAWQSETFSLAWNTTLGAMKIPFSRQSLTSTTQLQFIRRAMVVEEMPTRYDIGAQFDQEYALSSRVSGREIVKIDLNAGAFNGRGDRVYGPDNNDNLMYVGRARLDLIAPMRSGKGTRRHLCGRTRWPRTARNRICRN